MRLKVFLALAVAVVVLFGGFEIRPARAYLPYDGSQITDESADQREPAVYLDNAVWTDYRNGPDPGNGDIYMSNVYLSGTERQITTNPRLQWHPDIDGNIIVWEDRRNDPENRTEYGDNGDIYIYDLSTSTEKPIAFDVAEQCHPAISGDTIVWEDHRNGLENADIYMYDLSKSREKQITFDYSDQWYPAVSGDIIVWVDYRNGNPDIYMYDLSTLTEKPITTNPAAQWNPAVYGNIIVWTDYRNGPGPGTELENADIYMYDLSTSTERQITTNTQSQKHPDVYGNIIVWDDNRFFNVVGYQYTNIMQYDLYTSTEAYVTYTGKGGYDQYFPAVSGGIIVWEDNRNGNWDIYAFAPISWEAASEGGATMTIVSNSSEIPPKDFEGTTEKEQNNRRNALVNKLDAVIADIKIAMESADPAIQKSAYRNATDLLKSILDKIDGYSERGTPDTRGSGNTPDWIITPESQAKIDPPIRHLILMLTLLAQNP